uniref:Transmembrane protein 65 n=1 Tax=Oryzias sinensis TaxID=183150 RepID=A0A8C7ZZM7_9TELE
MLVQRRNLGTHSQESVEPLNSPRGAKEFIYSLHPSERTCLLRELHRFESIAIAQGQLEVAPPTAAQLRYVLLHNALPFVGFGFLDNCIMIVAGTQIELSIGVILGISTMAGTRISLKYISPASNFFQIFPKITDIICIILGCINTVVNSAWMKIAYQSRARVG